MDNTSAVVGSMLHGNFIPFLSPFFTLLALYVEEKGCCSSIAGAGKCFELGAGSLGLRTGGGLDAPTCRPLRRCHSVIVLVLLLRHPSLFHLVPPIGGQGKRLGHRSTGPSAASWPARSASATHSHCSDGWGQRRVEASSKQWQARQTTLAGRVLFCGP